MRVHIVDPSAYTPPYDHALCRALARAGAEVELYTSRFTYGSAPAPEGYLRHEHFYRLAHGVMAGTATGDEAAPPRGRSRAARAAKLAEHVPDMLRYRRLARQADVVHFQWLPVQPLDVHLLPRRGPASGRRPRLVLTAHDILPREPRPGQRAGQLRLYEQFDAIVVHSEHGRARLTGELGVDPSRIHVIPHGALRPWEDARRAPRAGGTTGLPAGFSQFGGPVALFIGLLRPYKGLDVLLDAWRTLQDGQDRLPIDPPEAELWVVGMERMDLARLRSSAPPNVRFLTRFVSDDELEAFLHRASLVVLPYREIDASGAAFSAIGAGAPLLLSDAGGFPEIAASGAARTVPVGDAAALAGALRDLLGDPRALEKMAQGARDAADGVFGWDGIARETLALYSGLLSENPAR
jgi:glycosyltransferase involved in cell wall biosynthesis